MPKKIIQKRDAINKLLEGARQITEPITRTFGPKGSTVLIGKSYGMPTATKDGVSVAKAIELLDMEENVGAQLIKSASSKTVDEAGDGTTATAILTYEMMKNAVVSSYRVGSNQAQIKKGMEMARDAILSNLNHNSTRITNTDAIAQVATISANGDYEIGKMIADAMERIGDDGVITVEDGKSMHTEIEVTEGMQFDKGYMSSYFVTKQEQMICEFDDPFILLYEKKLSTVQAILPVIEQVASTGKPLLIIADDVDSEIISMLAVNKMRGALKVCVVKTPGFGDRKKAIMEDIAILTGGQFICDEMGMKIDNVKLDMLGKARRVVITKDNTTIVDGGGEKHALQARCQLIREFIKESTSEYETEKLRERLAKLVSGIAVIKVGAVTEAEAKEKRDRIEDALLATKAAKRGGIVPGGGVALLRCVKDLEQLKWGNEDQRDGIRIVQAAIRRPAGAIVENAGESADAIIHRILEVSEYNYGYDVMDSKFCNLIEKGVIDPTDVVKQSVISAVSVASTAICTGALITDIKEKEERAAPGPDMGMGGF